MSDNEFVMKSRISEWGEALSGKISKVFHRESPSDDPTVSLPDAVKNELPGQVDRVLSGEDNAIDVLTDMIIPTEDTENSSAVRDMIDGYLEEHLETPDDTGKKYVREEFVKTVNNLYDNFNTVEIVPVEKAEEPENPMITELVEQAVEPVKPVMISETKSIPVYKERPGSVSAIASVNATLQKAVPETVTQEKTADVPKTSSISSSPITTPTGKIHSSSPSMGNMTRSHSTVTTRDAHTAFYKSSPFNGPTELY